MRIHGLVLVSLLALLSACGGGGSSDSSAPSSGPSSSSPGTTLDPPVAHSIPVTVQLYGDGIINVPYVSVKVCAPGSTVNCQTINNILLDTGSFGLRINSNILTIGLPYVTVSGQAISECGMFTGGDLFGPIASADVYLAGEKASAIPIQLVDDPTTDSPPSGCLSQQTDPELSAFANGILGVGPQIQDCGDYCTTTPYFYYTCPSTGCVEAVVPLNAQVVNPIAAFPQDNNGIAVTFPAVTSANQDSLVGTLKFGIGTQPDNSISSTATILTLISSLAFNTQFNGESYSGIIDSGTNVYFFPDASITTCAQAPTLFCPTSPVSITGTNSGGNGTSLAFNLTIDNALDLLSGSDATLAAVPNIGASSSNTNFIFGAPFFFDRTVYFGYAGRESAGTTGPFVAY